MSEKPRMKSSVARRATETEPKNGFGSVSGQLSMELRTVAEWREIIYEALRVGVDAGYAKRSEFADATGKSNGEISKRLNHAIDEDTLKEQLAHIDLLAFVAMKVGGLEAFCEHILRPKGARIEVVVAPPSPDEERRAMASEMTEKQRRRLEAERGWPKGWLDR